MSQAAQIQTNQILAATASDPRWWLIFAGDFAAEFVEEIEDESDFCYSGAWPGIRSFDDCDALTVRMHIVSTERCGSYREHGGGPDARLVRRGCVAGKRIGRAHNFYVLPAGEGGSAIKKFLSFW